MLVLVHLESDVNTQMITLKKNILFNKKIQKYTKISKNIKEKYINVSGKKAHGISHYFIVCGDIFGIPYDASA